jgi:NAD(P)-dependent dehydrogenase (short-subunit alcohol dehydrogenase family)
MAKIVNKNVAVTGCSSQGIGLEVRGAAAAAGAAARAASCRLAALQRGRTARTRRRLCPSGSPPNPHRRRRPPQFLRQLLAPERKNTCIAAARRVSPELKRLADEHPGRLELTQLDVADEGSVAAWAKGLADKARWGRGGRGPPAGAPLAMPARGASLPLHPCTPPPPDPAAALAPRPRRPRAPSSTL